VRIEDTLLGLVIQTFFAGVLAFLLGIRKAKLQRHLDTEASQLLDRLRSELSRADTEHRVRFTRLYEQRAKVIAGTFARLDRLHRAVRNMPYTIEYGVSASSTEQSPRDAYRAFEAYYFERAIWLDTDTIALINEILDLLTQPLLRLQGVAHDDNGELQRVIREIKHITERLVPDARKHLEARFRALLTGLKETEMTANHHQSTLRVQ